MVALGGHRRYCDGGTWRCNWCDCTYEVAKGKAPGPDGPKTLCAACGSRFRAGHSGPPKKDDDGMYVCPTCHKRFGTIPALGGHRRYCDPTGKHDSLHNDDLELFSETLIADQQISATKAIDSKESPTAESVVDIKANDQSKVIGSKPSLRQASKSSDDRMLAPQAKEFHNTSPLVLDMFAFSDWLLRFSTDLNLPVLTVDRIFALLRDPASDTENVLPNLHISMMKLLTTEMHEQNEAFYNVNMKIADDMLDEITWPEILRLRISLLEDVPANRAVRRAIDAVHTHGYGSISMTQKLCLLGYLCTEVLSTSRCKEVIDSSQEQVEKIDQDRMRFGMDKKRKANEKEVTKWVGKRVVLSCGSHGLVESGSRGVFRIKLDHPEGKVGIKIGKSDTSGDGKRDKGGICLRRPSEMRFVNENDVAGKTKADDKNSVAKDQPTQKSKIDTGQEEDLKITPEEQKVITEQDELLEQLSIRTEPLGSDRYFNQYWWFPSNPSRLYLEERPGIARWLPLNVQGFKAAKGSIDDRRAAAHKSICSELSKMSLESLQKQFDAASVDRNNLNSKEELLEVVSRDPRGCKLHPVAVECARKEKVRQDLDSAPLTALQEGLAAFGIDFEEEKSKAELVKLVQDHKVGARIKCSPSEWDPNEGSQRAKDALAAGGAQHMLNELANTGSSSPQQGSSRWLYFDTVKQIDQLLKYLNPSGPRERQLKERIEVLYTKIVAAVSEASTDKTDLMNRPENASKSDFNTNTVTTDDVDSAVLDKAKNLMVQVRENNVVVNASNKPLLVKWFKNLLAADTWDLVLPLVLELAELVDKTAQNTDAFLNQPGLPEQWAQWLQIWRQNLQKDTNGTLSASRLMFALYAFREVSGHS